MKGQYRELPKDLREARIVLNEVTMMWIFHLGAHIDTEPRWSES